MQQKAEAKMKKQEDTTERLVKIVDTYTDQFDTLITRQTKIDEQLSTQNASLIFLQDRIEHIFQHIYGDQHKGIMKEGPPKLAPYTVTPIRNLGPPPTSSIQEGGTQL